MLMDHATVYAHRRRWEVYHYYY